MRANTNSVYFEPFSSSSIWSSHDLYEREAEQRGADHLYRIMKPRKIVTNRFVANYLRHYRITLFKNMSNDPIITKVRRKKVKAAPYDRPIEAKLYYLDHLLDEHKFLMPHADKLDLLLIAKKPGKMLTMKYLKAVCRQYGREVI